MKLIVLAVVVVFVTTGLVCGQSAKSNNALEQQIRKLELAHADAILHRDVEALKSLIAENATTNHPTNKIVKEREGIFELIRNGTINYSSFVREPEAFLFYKNMVVVMGNETLTMESNTVGGGQTIHRRYTNVWMKRKGKWLLTIRHANIICPN